MLLCLKSYATYFVSQQTFSPILTCRWKLPCAFKIKKDAEPCQCTVAGHRHPALAQKWWWQGICKPFTLAEHPQGSDPSSGGAEVFVCRPVSLFEGRCQVHVYGQPYRLALLWTCQGAGGEMKVVASMTESFQSHGTCFLSRAFWRLWFSTWVGLRLQHAWHKPAFLAFAARQCVCYARLLLTLLCSGVVKSIALMQILWGGSNPWLNDHAFTGGCSFLTLLVYTLSKSWEGDWKCIRWIQAWFLTFAMFY